jgi:hypothetical protein
LSDLDNDGAGWRATPRRRRAREEITDRLMAATDPLVSAPPVSGRRAMADFLVRILQEAIDSLPPEGGEFDGVGHVRPGTKVSIVEDASDDDQIVLMFSQPTYVSYTFKIAESDSE